MIVAVMVKLLKLTEFGHPASLGLGLPHSQLKICSLEIHSKFGVSDDIVTKVYKSKHFVIMWKSY